MENKLAKLFGFNASETKISTEILAGVTTFLAMAYILVVNPNILSATGMDKNALFTTTIIATVVSTLVMAFVAKLPYALAPGMGLNAFFAFTVCGAMGHTWQFALTAVLIEGIIFIVLTVTGLREFLVNAVPSSLRKAIGAGIGLFIAFIGLQGGHVIIDNGATLVELGDLTSGPALLSIIGLAITSILLVLKVPGAFLIGIVSTALIGIPMGLTQFGGIISMPPSPEPIMLQMTTNPSEIFSLDMLVVVFTFLFVDMFDTIGVLLSISEKAKMYDENGRPLRLNQGFFADAVGTTFGALMGTSTVTTYVESASGIAQGGRSGLTAFVVAVCFMLALFFAPIFTAIPGAAVCPVLVFVGLFMLSPLKEIDLDDFSESIPAFLCLITIPLSYSISNGIMIGMIAYVFLNLLSKKCKNITPLMGILAVIFILKFIFLK